MVIHTDLFQRHELWACLQSVDVFFLLLSFFSFFFHSALTFWACVLNSDFLLHFRAILSESHVENKVLQFAVSPTFLRLFRCWYCGHEHVECTPSVPRQIMTCLTIWQLHNLCLPVIFDKTKKNSNRTRIQTAREAANGYLPKSLPPLIFFFHPSYVFDFWTIRGFWLTDDESLCLVMVYTG